MAEGRRNEKERGRRRREGEKEGAGGRVRRGGCEGEKGPLPPYFEANFDKKYTIL